MEIITRTHTFAGKQWRRVTCLSFSTQSKWCFQYNHNTFNKTSPRWHYLKDIKPNTGDKNTCKHLMNETWPESVSHQVIPTDPWTHDQSSHCPLVHCSITKWGLSSWSLNTLMQTCGVWNMFLYFSLESIWALGVDDVFFESATHPVSPYNSRISLCCETTCDNCTRGIQLRKVMCVYM